VVYSAISWKKNENFYESLRYQYSAATQLAELVETYKTYFNRHLNSQKPISNVRVRWKEVLDKKLRATSLTNVDFYIADPEIFEKSYRSSITEQSLSAPGRDVLKVVSLSIRITGQFKHDVELFAFQDAMIHFPKELVTHQGCKIIRGKEGERHKLDCSYTVYDFQTESSAA